MKKKGKTIQDPNPIEHYNYIQESKILLIINCQYRYWIVGGKYKGKKYIGRTAIY